MRWDRYEKEEINGKVNMSVSKKTYMCTDTSQTDLSRSRCIRVHTRRTDLSIFRTYVPCIGMCSHVQAVVKSVRMKHVRAVAQRKCMTGASACAYLWETKKQQEAGRCEKRGEIAGAKVGKGKLRECTAEATKN